MRSPVSADQPPLLRLSRTVGADLAGDLCYHTLLINDDTRYRSYCLLLLSHVNEATLWDRADKYGLGDTIDALLRYLDTTDDIQDDGLPEWSEFQKLAADYEVPLPQRDCGLPESPHRLRKWNDTNQPGNARDSSLRIRG